MDNFEVATLRFKTKPIGNKFFQLIVAQIDMGIKYFACQLCPLEVY